MGPHDAPTPPYDTGPRPKPVNEIPWAILHPNESPTAAPVPKVWASSAGAGLGGAIGAVVVWGMEQAGLNVTPEVGISISTICSIVAGFAAGYLTPPRSV